MTKALVTNYTAADIKPGLKLACNGFPAQVKEVHGDGTIIVFVPGGETVAYASELVRFQNDFSAALPHHWRNW